MNREHLQRLKARMLCLSMILSLVLLQVCQVIPGAETAAAAPAYALAQQAERSPDGSVTFTAGSLIIPMDATYQNLGMWRAYGLVYRLLQNGVPVSWAIDPTKAYNGVDFTASAINARTNATINGGNPWSYTGGPFVVDQAYAATALPLIQAWWGQYANQPEVHKSTASFTANVAIVLKRAPRIALDAVNANIAITYFNAAGIPDNSGSAWSTSSTNVLTQATIVAGGLFETGVCGKRKYDVFVTPHNNGYDYSLTDPSNLGTRTYAALDYFVYQGGGWLALCHSILSNENAINALYRNGNAGVRALFNPNAQERVAYFAASGIPSFNSNTVTNTLRAAPALSIVKSANPVSGFTVQPGDTINYTLLVANTGTAAATGLTVTDPIAALTTYVAASCTASLGSCSYSSGPPAKVTFTVGTIAAGGSATLAFQVTVDSPSVQAGLIQNAATLEATGLLPITSNYASHEINAAPALSIVKSATPASGSSVHPGDTITYRLEVTNIGNANTATAYVRDAIPQYTTYIVGTTQILKDSGFVTVPELASGQSPVETGMAVFSPCCGDPDADGGVLVVGAANKAVVTFQVQVNTSATNHTITNVATAGAASASEVTSNQTTHQLIPLAILLAGMEAVQVEDYVLVTWETNSEINNRGFNLWRGTSPSGPDIQLNTTLIPSQSQGNPGGFVYTWEDRANLVDGATYYYWLEDVDLSGATTLHGPVSATVQAPTSVTLSGLQADAVTKAPGLFWLWIAAGAGVVLGLSR